MSDQLEEFLARTLAGAAEAAPDVDADLAAAVTGRYRRRRRTARAATAAATVVALGVGGVAVASRPDRPASSDVTATGVPSPSPTPTRSPDAAPTVRQRPGTEPLSVLGAAVRRVPVRLPDGRAYDIDAVLDRSRLVVHTYAGFEKVSEILVWDTSAGTVRVVTRVQPAPTATFYGVGTIVVGAGRVAWVAGYDNTPEQIDLWSVPLDGGAAVRAARLTGLPQYSRLDGLSIDGDHLVWSMARVGGVWRVPVSGGTPTMIAGSAGLHVVAWPWIGTPPEPTEDLPVDKDGVVPGVRDAPGARVPGGPLVRFLTLWNVQTGERRSITTRATDGYLNCAQTWCVGATTSRDGEGYGVVRRDGSGWARLPWLEGPGNEILRHHMVVADDRFLVYSIQQGDRMVAVFYDVLKNRLVELGSWGKSRSGGWRVVEITSRSFPTTATFVSWDDDWDAPTQRRVLDLTAIE